MGTIYFKQKIAAILPWAIAVSVALAPAPMLLMLALYRLAQQYPDWRKIYQYLMISALTLDVIGLCIAVQHLGVGVFIHVAPSSFVDWVFFPAPPQLLVPLLTMVALTSAGYASADTMLLKAAERTQQNQYELIREIDYTNKSHTLVAGTTGSGKTTYLLQYIYAAIAGEAALSKSRYVDLLLGDGGWFFGSVGDGGINAAKARKDDAVFFADLDSFKYTDYTKAIGKLFISDIRHLIATERPTEWRKIIILDELGAYATEQLMPIFAQARSQGYQIIVATQSIADLSAVSETFAERVLENCGQYAVLRLNAAQDAEMMANIIGTAEVVETTHKSSGTLLDAGGAGSKKVVREYKVSPDMIKELPPLQAIIYDKQDIHHIKLIQIPFIDL